MCAKLHALIYDLMQWTASKNWMHRFLKRNVGQITAKRTHGLNPKCAQGFNQPVVECHFKHLQSLIVEQGIPPENIYNEDEEGIQLGGEEHPPPIHFSSQYHEWFTMWLESLVLVMLLEAVSADGAAIPPMFVLQVDNDDLGLPGIGG